MCSKITSIQSKAAEAVTNKRGLSIAEPLWSFGAGGFNIASGIGNGEAFVAVGAAEVAAEAEVEVLTSVLEFILIKVLQGNKI